MPAAIEDFESVLGQLPFHNKCVILGLAALEFRLAWSGALTAHRGFALTVLWLKL